ncbi:MAG: hypothetical protein RLN96_02510, partial [Pseudomonadales bacterium]
MHGSTRVLSTHLCPNLDSLDSTGAVGGARQCRDLQSWGSSLPFGSLRAGVRGGGSHSSWRRSRWGGATAGAHWQVAGRRAPVSVRDRIYGGQQAVRSAGASVSH